MHGLCLPTERRPRPESIRQRGILIELVERLRVDQPVLDCLFLVVVGARCNRLLSLVGLLDDNGVPVNAVHSEEARLSRLYHHLLLDEVRPHGDQELVLDSPGSDLDDVPRQLLTDTDRVDLFACGRQLLLTHWLWLVWKLDSPATDDCWRTWSVEGNSVFEAEQLSLLLDREVFVELQYLLFLRKRVASCRSLADDVRELSLRSGPLLDAAFLNLVLGCRQFRS